jgi:hypothetical protein
MALSRKEVQQRYREKVRRDTIEAYGGMCDVCGSIKDLEVDHENGLGNHHRDSIFHQGHRSPGGWNFYLWLKKNGYPKKGYRLLCKKCHDDKHPLRKSRRDGFVDEIQQELDIIDPIPF